VQTHETVSSFRSVTRASDRKFGFTIGVILVAFGLWPIARGASAPNFWLLAPAVALLAATLLAPARLAPLNRAWFRLGLALNSIVSPIVMAMLFFGAVMPIGLLLRRNGKDLLQLELSPEADTYWTPRDPAGPLPGSFVKQF
jgi:hypothetical protein